MSIGKGTKSAKQLREYFERIEDVRARKKRLGEEESAIFAEAKAEGFKPPVMRTVLKLRAQKPEAREEAATLLDTYLHAIGMAEEPPLFKALGAMAVDLAVREQAIEFLKKIVPAAGEIVLKLGGTPVRLYRDGDGVAHADEVEDIAPSVKALRRAADELEETYGPAGAGRLPSKEHVMSVADRAEASAKEKRLREAAALDAKRAAEAAPAAS